MKTLLTIAFGLFLFSNASAANIESVFLPKDMNQCIRSLDLPYSMHTERIKNDLLGGYAYVNPYRNVEMMLFMTESDKTGCGKKVLNFIQKANMIYLRTGKYPVYGRKDGTEALNRLGFFLRQRHFFYGGL